MARLKDTVIPLGDYPTGTHVFGPATISNQATKIGFEVARCTSADPSIWPSEATTIDVQVEASIDNGQTWTAAGGFGAMGGIHVNARDGTESSASWYVTGIPAGNNRRIRGTVTIVSGPLRTSGSIVIITP